MISRIYIAPKKDTRGQLCLKSWMKLGLFGKIKNVELMDSYIVEGDFKKEDVEKSAQTLTNPILEKFSVDKLPITKQANFIIEIGFLPGVTDNVGHTAQETITDLLHLNEGEKLAVYFSKVFIISGKVSQNDVGKIALSLHNPLIEEARIFNVKEIKKKEDLPRRVPEVVLKKTTAVISVPLEVRDEELVKIGKEGIDEGGKRRGPLALDLTSMREIQNYFSKLNRQPNDIELESLAQTWSEHCKHTIFANPLDEIKDGLYKTYIKGATNEIRKRKSKKPARLNNRSGGDFCVSVFSDNAGGIVFDDEFLVTHKVETHNSPSALDPFGGAITGIVGVNRDTIGFGLGAKPVANIYGFCFGEPDDTRPIFRDSKKRQQMFPPRRIMEGIIKGINSGGNCSGIPTISGFTRYDDRFKGKPMVFAGTVGIIPRKSNGKFLHEKSAEVGDYIVMVGGRVGADGIHGATFSSVEMNSSSPATAVQIGDPITQKKMSDAIVKEARNMNLYNSITDNGAGGLSCSVAEMAKECGGAYVHLEKVPLKYPGLRPWEIWISESQERMTLSVPKKKWSVFNSLMQSRGVEATVIGEFTNSGKCTVAYNGEEIMNISLEFLHNGLPKRNLKSAPVSHLYTNPQTPPGVSRTKVFEELVIVNNLSGTAFISEQYDHEVQASSVLKPLSGRGRINTEAQVFRPVLTSPKGVVLSSGIYPSYSDINTYHMAACAIDTAIRNAVCAGATLSHLAILDNFCWSSSDDPKRLRELKDAVRACYDYAVGYGTPFISGKDSMFNDFKGYDEKGNPIKISIPPTLLISAIGVMPDILKTVSPEFKNSGDIIYLLGETHDELGASEYFKMLAKKQKSNAIGNNVPKVDCKKNLKTYSVLEEAIKEELVSSAISVNSGGLAVALAKACVGGMLGCDINVGSMLGDPKSADAKLFSESQGRILLSVSPKNKAKFERIMKGISHAKLGEVRQNGKIIIKNSGHRVSTIKVVDTDVKKLYKIYHDFSNSMK
ncbi:MAG: AIR synthase-related protein [bacterium]|nr:AIR synthase-related protein [bacterium]